MSPKFICLNVDGADHSSVVATLPLPSLPPAIQANDPVHPEPTALP